MTKYVATLVVILAVAGGCGRSSAPETAAAPAAASSTGLPLVQGILVDAKGEVVLFWRLVLVPEGEQPTEDVKIAGPTDKDGAFQLQSSGQLGVQPGVYNGFLQSYSEYTGMSPPRAVPNDIPQRYRRP